MGEVLELLKEAVFRNRSRHAVPLLDGPLAPDDRLAEAVEKAALLEIAEPDDLLVIDGVTYISSANTILRLSSTEAKTEVFATLAGHAGGLALDHRDGSIYACVDGSTIERITSRGETRPVPGGSELRCALALEARGRYLYVAEGSQLYRPENWAHSWAQRDVSGRILQIDTDTGEQRELATALGYPMGLAFDNEGESLLFTESWAHRIRRLWLPERGHSSLEDVVPNLPGFPARIRRDPDGGWWVAVFALRTHLLDFIVTQKDYMREMAASVDCEHWIRPRLRPVTSLPFLAPLQGGGIMVLGRKRYSAPPATYGLVVRLDENARTVDSLHDHEGGRLPGIVAVTPNDGDLLLASKGGDAVAVLTNDGRLAPIREHGEGRHI